GKARAKSRTRSALTAISLPTRERFLVNAPVTLPHWVQHGAIRLSRSRPAALDPQRSFPCARRRSAHAPHLPFALPAVIGSIGWIAVLRCEHQGCSARAYIPTFGLEITGTVRR